MGFVVRTAGIKLDRFKKNPVMLDMHDTGKLLGKWDDIKLEDDASITAAPNFNMKNDNAKTRSQEVEDGYLSGASLGLIPLAFAKGSQYPELNLDDDDLVLADSEMTECSLCPIPTNSNALALYDKGGKRITEEQLQEIKLSMGIDSNTKKTTDKMDKLDITQVCIVIGLAATSTPLEVIAALQKMKNEHTNLTQEIGALKLSADTQKNSNIENMVQLAIDAKKITVSQKDTYMKLAKADFDSTKKVLDDIPAVVNLAVASTTAPGAEDKGEDRSKWSFEDWTKKDSAGLQLMQTNDAERFNKLLNAQYPKAKK